MEAKLYDKESSVIWTYSGTKTKAEMENDEELKFLFSHDCVLFVDDEGKAYTWRFLSTLCNKYGVEITGNTEADFSSVVKAMNEQEEPTLTLESVDAKATEAKTTADAATLAIGELGVMAADAQVTNSQLAQAVAELGVLVAGISAE